MAAQALMTGTVLIKGDGFPPALVDFGRDAALTVALCGSSQWGQSGGLPSRDIEHWQRPILKKSGAQVTDLISTTTPWACFIADDTVKAAVYYPKLADFGNAINPAAQITTGAVYKGRWGQYDLWVYNDWYVDDNDVEQPMLLDGSVIMAGPDLMGTRAFGQIMVPKFNYQAFPIRPSGGVACAWRRDPRLHHAGRTCARYAGCSSPMTTRVRFGSTTRGANGTARFFCPAAFVQLRLGARASQAGRILRVRFAAVLHAQL